MWTWTGFGNVCDADCTDDAIVGGPDFILLISEFGADCNAFPALICACDFNGDGVVGGADFITLSAHFGENLVELGFSDFPCAVAGATDCYPSLAILDPIIDTSFSTDPVQSRIRYSTPAVEGTLTLLLNGQTVSTPSPGANETTISLGSVQGLQPGRNVLIVHLESNDPTATVSKSPMFAPKRYLARQRVFYFDDSDLDGVPNSEDVTAGADESDNDNDGLPDSVEARPLASGKIVGTSFDGTITVTSVTPNPAIPGHVVVIKGTGLEAIDLPGEVIIGGIPSPSLAYRSPGAIVATVPPELDGQSSASLILVDSTGSSFGNPAAISLGMDEMPATDVSQNLVMVAGIFAQVFQDAAGTITSAPLNVPFFNNLLQFGSNTRVLIDASNVRPLDLFWVAPFVPPSVPYRI